MRKVGVSADGVKLMASQVMERSIYNGLFQLVHNPNARGRTPRYIVNDSERPKGVTTILGAVLAKDLMGWALSCMADYLKAKLPVVTQADLDEAKLESTRRRDSGAGTGTEAHALVENFLKGIADTTTPSPEAQKAFNAFREWFLGSKPEVINVEEVIYSKSFKYAGTYDCMLRIDGKVYLCDLKTTNVSRKAPNGVYAENFLQLGAYAFAHEEQRLYEESNGGTKLLPIEGLLVISAKKNGKLDLVSNEDLGVTLVDCIEMFKRVMNLYEFMNYLTKGLGGK